MGVLALAGMAAAAFFLSARSAVQSSRRWTESDQLMLTAQGALEEAKIEIGEKYTRFARTRLMSWQAINWFDSHSASSIGSVFPYQAPQGRTYENNSIRVWIELGDVSLVDRRKRDVTIRARARFNGRTDMERSVEEVVRFQIAPSRVFDYAYFLNNFGWLYGNIAANGDVRANGDFVMRNGMPLINGDIFAAMNPDIGDLGQISGDSSFWSRPQYFASASTQARPGSPTIDGESEWAMGYDGSSEKFQNLQPLEMPYLGDLSSYRNLAHEVGGSVWTNIGVSSTYSQAVVEVYDGPGPDGQTNTPDDGVVILDGTINPIRIDGLVVIDKDVVIKGKVTGRGVIYAGRNIHIAGDVTYDNPPVWAKPDTDPEGSAAVNRNRDLVAFAAKGNIIIGDYLPSPYWNKVKTYMKPPWTRSYRTDETDAPNGYDSDKNANNGYRFDGNYTGFDGGTVNANSQTNAVVNRRFYEASIPADRFRGFVQSDPVDRVDAVLYSNHLIAGSLGSGRAVFNGSVVSRDESLVYGEQLTFNWDIRLGSESPDSTDMEIYLPHEFARPWMRIWREIP